MRAAAILPLLALLATADARKCKAKSHSPAPPAATPPAEDNTLIHQPTEPEAPAESPAAESPAAESPSAAATPTESSAAAEPTQPAEPEQPEGPANLEGALPGSDPKATELLDAHNEIRRRYGQPDLWWNDELSAIAVGQAQTCNMVPQFPATRQDYTDSLVPNHDGNFVRSVHDAGWEGENYVYPEEGGDKTYQEAAARWTQVVWKSTTDVGCGWHKCDEWVDTPSLNGQWKFVCELRVERERRELRR